MSVFVACDWSWGSECVTGHVPTGVCVRVHARVVEGFQGKTRFLLRDAFIPVPNTTDCKAGSGHCFLHGARFPKTAPLKPRAVISRMGSL